MPNLKDPSGLCRVACAVTGQLLPGKVSENKQALGACVLAYYVLSLASFLFSRIVTQEYFLVVLACPDENLPKLRMMFKMKRLDPKFRLVLASKEKCGLT